MPRENINAILAFLAVAQERSFTRAAGKLGISHSALSHTIRELDTRLGVRPGQQIQKDMVAVRLTPEIPMTIVGAPRYFETHKVPLTVQDLMRHNCITLRLSGNGGLYAWELRQDGRDVEARVNGQVTFSG